VDFDSGNADWVGSELTLGHQIGAHRLTLGAQYEYSFRVDQKDAAAAVNDHHTLWLAAVFGEMELHLTPEFTLHAGGRYDSFKDFGGAISPCFAAIYSPSPRTALKYVYGRAFRAPNAYESYYADDVALVAPQSPLHPENIQSHEVILEHSLSSWLSLTADGFYRRLSQLIDQRIVDPSTGLAQYVNSGGDSGRGIELELGAQRSSGLAARASYSLTEAVDKAGQRLAASPLHLAKLNATLPIHAGTSFGAELLYASPQQSYWSTRIPSSFVTNVTLSTRPLWGGWLFSASCYNLFDRGWYSPTGLQFSFPAIQQDGRSVRLQITYRLGGEAKRP
jgi:iron complex outermembrane receptor protein